MRHQGDIFGTGKLTNHLAADPLESVYPNISQ
jgi:hypothetical protein